MSITVGIGATGWEENEVLHRPVRITGVKMPKITPPTGYDAIGYVSEVKIRAGYWRKCNQIHGWFVNNVQNGKDECQEAYCTKEQIIALQTLVDTVLESKSPETASVLLPRMDGFFFGNRDEIPPYNEDKNVWDYWQDLRETKEILANALALYDTLEAQEGKSLWLAFEYQSSW